MESKKSSTSMLNQASMPFKHVLYMQWISHHKYKIILPGGGGGIPPPGGGGGGGGGTPGPPGGGGGGGGGGGAAPPGGGGGGGGGGGAAPVGAADCSPPATFWIITGLLASYVCFKLITSNTCKYLTSSFNFIISASLEVISVSYFILASLSCSVVFIKFASTSFRAVSSRSSYALKNEYHMI